jgi:hypothetical protein
MGTIGCSHDLTSGISNSLAAWELKKWGKAGSL